MRYSLDLSVLSIHEYKNILKSHLLPGRRILWQDIDQNFEQFEHFGMKDVAGLKKHLSTPQRITALSAGTGIPEDYLTMLKREIGSLEQKPVPLENFPGIEPSVLAHMKSAGIQNSKEYFEKAGSTENELYCLCNLVRINGVGAIAAKAFYEAGYRTAAEVARAEAAIMLEKVSNINKIKQYYKASLGEKDMQFCIDFALLLVKYCD